MPSSSSIPFWGTNCVFSTLINTFLIGSLGYEKRRPFFNNRLEYIGFYEVKSKKICCPKVSKPLILLGFSKSSVSPLAPENDKFRQKLVVFSYIRLTASYMHLRCVIFASQVICLRALGANIISLKP